MKTNYILKCLGCNAEITDDNITLSCTECDKDALLRTEYTRKEICVSNNSRDIYKYSDWLPIRRRLEGSSAPVTYKSVQLGKFLGLNNLYITFNGYWPEKGVDMTTGTFKECEAYSIGSRLPETFDKTLVVASAGNTARAFAKSFSENNIPVLIIVPEKNLKSMWFNKEINSCVKLLAAGGDSDYLDAIELADLISTIDGFTSEGGAKNVARRDGMGTTVLSAVTTIGEIPDYYFQAVGSGTGAIAAWEANLRFIESGKYGKKKMKLQVSQNAPFNPIYDSWRNNKKELIELSEQKAKSQLNKIWAKVLSNRRPCYGTTGGLHDALNDTNGNVCLSNNNEAMIASEIFEEMEGNDISPPASIALANLMKCAKNGMFDKNDIIALNITGGGMKRFKKESNIFYLQPDFIIPKDGFFINKIKEILTRIY